MHPLPPHCSALAASRERSAPQAAHFVAELLDGMRVAGNAVVLAVPAYYRAEPTTDLGDRRVPTLPQLFAHLLELGSHPLAHRVPLHREPSSPSSSTHVHKPQKLEGLWFLLAPLLAVTCGVPPKLQQARFVRVQRQAKLPQPLP